MSTIITRRVAARQHRCECGATIAAGEVHLEHVTFEPFGPRRTRECGPCARDNDRAYELGDVPWLQLAKQGLL